MKIYKTIVLASALLIGTIAVAQDKNPKGITKESTKKTYKLYENGKLIKNSVLIETVRNQAVMLDQKDENKINQSRIMPPTVVIKTVKIDNDADEQYDEIIKFSYTTKEKTDFTLVSDRDNLRLAVEDGENITILENRIISLTKGISPKKAYVFTTNDGNEIEFKLQSFKRVGKEDSK